MSPSTLGPYRAFIKAFINQGTYQHGAADRIGSHALALFEKSMGVMNKHMFVVMKFGDDELDSAYEGVIEPIGHDYGFHVRRIDEVQDSGNITHQILKSISSSSVVLADLTGERPNCYYEAGYAHARGKEMILAIKHGSSVHFDLAAYRFITWKTEAEYRRKLRERLESMGIRRRARKN